MGEVRIKMKIKSIYLNKNSNLKLFWGFKTKNR